MIRIAAVIILAMGIVPLVAQTNVLPAPAAPAPTPLLSPAARAAAAAATELADAEKLFRTGQYHACALACEAAIDSRQWSEEWWILKIRSEMATGEYESALKTYQQGIEVHRCSVQMRLVGYDVYRANGDPQWAEQALQEVRELVGRDPRRYSDAVSRVVIGRALLLSGADARQVLELFYDTAKKLDPASAVPHIASGELALSKQDYALAAESFAEAAKRSPNDPDIHFGLARAFHDDSDRATAALTRALTINPRHADSLLFQVDNAIDREAYEQAEQLIAQVLEVNPRRSEAHAYRAVLAHLRGDRKAEEAHRDAALGTWKTNPAVDHLIGLKLSQKYRFFEGQLYQRVALRFDRNYRPAKVQLCQDLLRLGEEDEGWQLAAEVFKEDPYNVVAYNLNTLHDHLAKFRTLQGEGFIVRMDAREADIYGHRVLELLAKARKELSEKYDVIMSEPITIEIFPSQKDFAIRTFGLPGGDGYLGVCFGPVITVNSPASRMARPVNWEAVVWHEFCHAVTLHKTRNKMPRWLSEGISVYEERERNRAWGQSMNPQYREMILGEGEENAITPVSQLSGAFLQPPTPMHLQFAYYESSMVIEHIVERWGIEAIRKVLTDLGDDVPINAALAKHTEPIEKLDESFMVWLKQRADNLAPGIDWTQPDLSLDAGSEAMAAWVKEHPDSFWALLGQGRALLAEGKFEEAKRPLIKLIGLYPTYGEAGGPYVLLAAAHRELGETDAERAMLEKHVSLNADAIEPRLRLIELAAAAQEWKAVKALAEDVLAINPLIPLPHRYLAQSAEALSDRAAAVQAHRTLLQMDPLDAADHHYRLASLLAAEQQLPEARRAVVRALEEAPRFRAAHQLLLEIATKMDSLSPTTQSAAAAN
ncbi:MAG TPA: tetratricopeptide repeat protein [Tepidisphaeraceae bacterium]|nr:tetratricopeptide repeat protein [Tepidisphaeraceae bacterium]